MCAVCFLNLLNPHVPLALYHIILILRGNILYVLQIFVMWVKILYKDNYYKLGMFYIGFFTDIWHTDRV